MDSLSLSLSIFLGKVIISTLLEVLLVGSILLATNKCNMVEAIFLGGGEGEMASWKPRTFISGNCSYVSSASKLLDSCREPYSVSFQCFFSYPLKKTILDTIFSWRCEFALASREETLQLYLKNLLSFSSAIFPSRLEITRLLLDRLWNTRTCRPSRNNKEELFCSPEWQWCKVNQTAFL